ncbi:hypothetical protein Cpir12675_000411 [Ceratocystis pirilliformis]|uniref:Uncharacterized protein n=1 Tax=Ceratocystis pirilliformis TaxID=259994 RepID=A0ABR3ZMV0_9PEZI
MTHSGFPTASQPPHNPSQCHPSPASSFLADASAEINTLLANSQTLSPQTLSSHDSTESLQDSDTSIINRKRQITGFQGSFSSNVGTREWPTRVDSPTLEAGGVKALVAKVEANTRTSVSHRSSDGPRSLDSPPASPQARHCDKSQDQRDQNRPHTAATMSNPDAVSGDFDEKFHIATTTLQVTPATSPRAQSVMLSTPPNRESKDSPYLALRPSFKTGSSLSLVSAAPPDSLSTAKCTELVAVLEVPAEGRLCLNDASLISLPSHKGRRIPNKTQHLRHPSEKVGRTTYPELQQLTHSPSDPLPYIGQLASSCNGSVVTFRSSMPASEVSALHKESLARVPMRCASLQDRLQDFQKWLDDYLPPSTLEDVINSDGPNALVTHSYPATSALVSQNYVNDIKGGYIGSSPPSFMARHRSVNSSPALPAQKNGQWNVCGSRKQTQSPIQSLLQSPCSSRFPRRYTVEDTRVISRDLAPLLPLRRVRATLHSHQLAPSPLSSQSPRILHPPTRPPRFDTEYGLFTDQPPTLPARPMMRQDITPRSSVSETESQAIMKNHVETPPPPSAYRDPFFVPYQPSRTSSQHCRSREVSSASTTSVKSAPPIPIKSQRRASGRPLLYWTIFGQSIEPPQVWVPGGWI